MSRTRHMRGRLGLAGMMSALAALGVRGDRFSWEGGDGAFNDPNVWHGPNFPAHTRYPKAADDASITGNPTVTISGAEATHELVTRGATLTIAGSYTVESLFDFGSLLTFNGSGTLTASFWQPGAVSVIDGVRAQASMIQPLGSEIRIQGGGILASGALDLARGALKVVVAGAGSAWQHAEKLPFVHLVLGAGGNMEIPSADGPFLDASGGGAVLRVAGRYRGYAQVKNGARIESREGELSNATTLDGGTWAVGGTYLVGFSSLTIRNGGALTARDLLPAEFGSETTIEGVGSRMQAAGRLSPAGTILVRKGGLLRAGRATLDVGGVAVESDGSFLVDGMAEVNGGISVYNGGYHGASGMTLATAAGKGGALFVDGGLSEAEIQGDVIAGVGGEAMVQVRGKGTLRARSLEVGSAATASGELRIDSGGRVELGRELILGTQGRGNLSLDGGGFVRVGETAGGGTGGPPPPGGGAEPDCIADETGGPGSTVRMVLAEEAGSRGVAWVGGKGTELQVNGDLIIGGNGAGSAQTQGRMEIRDGARVQVSGRYVRLGQFRSFGSLLLSGPGSRLDGPATLEIGSRGDGELTLMGGASNAAPSTILGCLPGSSGTVQVDGRSSDGVPSTYVSQGSFTVGSRTRGVVSVSSGGLVRSQRRLVLGRFSGSDGHVTLMGGDSRWVHSADAGSSAPGEVIVGEAGFGEMTIRDKAVFETGPMVIGKQGVSSNALAEGRVIVRNGGVLLARGPTLTLGQESFSRGTLVLDGPTSTLGGVKTRNGGSGAALEVGRHGEGILVLTEGASLSQPSTILGSLPGSKGTLRVERDSLFESDGSVTVGGSAVGVIDVEAGGRVTSHGRGVVGRDADAEGTVTVRGRDAVWNHSADAGGGAPGTLVIGERGSGRLSVLEGARMAAGSLSVGVEGSRRGASAVLVKGGAGGQTSELTARDRTVVGVGGQGLLRLEEGARLALGKGADLTFSDLVVGDLKDSEGRLDVLGPRVTMDWGSTVIVGNRGRGDMNVVDLDGFGGETSLSVGDLILGAGAGGRGEVYLEGRHVRMQVRGLNLGGGKVGGTGGGSPDGGVGQLTILEGAVVELKGAGAPIEVTSPGREASSLFLGGTGSALVATRRALQLSGPATREGGRVLELKGGARLETARAVLGDGGGFALATLAGGESAEVRWSLHADDSSTNLLVIGGSSPAALAIGAQAVVSLEASKGNVLVSQSERGRLEVAGEGARLLATGNRIQVGSPGVPGSVVVSDGGEMVSRFISVRDGSDFTLKSSARVVAQGKLDISGGTAVVESGTLGAGTPYRECLGEACVVVSAQASSDSAFALVVGQGGKLYAKQSMVLQSRGGVAFNASLDEPVKFNGAMAVMVVAGGTIELGAQTANRDPSVIHVWSGGGLGGIGWIFGPGLFGKATVVVHRGGTFSLIHNAEVTVIRPGSPGNPLRDGAHAAQDGETPGTVTSTSSLRVDGDLVLEPGSTLIADVSGPIPIADYGVLEVTGTLTLGGRLLLNFTRGFAPKRGEHVELVRPGGAIPGRFEEVVVTGVAPGFQYEVAATPAGGLALTAMNDAIPTTSPVLAIESTASGVELSWPESVGGYRLEATPSLTVPAWVPLQTTSNRLSVGVEGSARYFRLRR